QRHYTEIIQRTFRDNKQTIIVELGCGTGENLIYFKEFFPNKNLKLIGIDHSHAMLNRAKEKLTNQSNNQIELLHGNLTNFADCFETQKIDCILLPAGTFHHLITDNERQEFINNIQQTLRIETGLFAIYLFPDSLIQIESIDKSENQDRLKETGQCPLCCKQLETRREKQLRTMCLSSVVTIFPFEILQMRDEHKRLRIRLNEIKTRLERAKIKLNINKQHLQKMNKKILKHCKRNMKNNV
ncbi:unnamed protein product, partial [Rotaria sp. Silwood2]